ncbi:MAG: hypothetical protein ACQETE_02495 [Bacteroidota bacterium]
MTQHAFAQLIQDTDRPIILLEGKRKVAPADKPKLVELGSMLAQRFPHARFRSGNAPGSDALFSEGVAAVDPDRLEVITPYDGHREKYSYTTHQRPLDELNLTKDHPVIYATKANHKNTTLIDAYVRDGAKGYRVKAAYLIRDTVKVLGVPEANLPPVTTALFYDDPDNPESGGTGHTMRVCREAGVPWVDQSEWLEWVDEE